MNIVEFVNKHHGQIVQKIEEVLTPIYHPGKETDEKKEGKIVSLLRRPYPVQAEIIKGLAKAMYEKGRKKVFVGGEMGTGKTTIAASVIHMSPKPLRTIVVCPTHLVQKWRREISMIVPWARVIDLSGKDIIAKLNNLRGKASPPETHEFYVISKERAKLSYGWKPALWIKKTKWGPNPVCPSCGAIPVDEEGEPISEKVLLKKKNVCQCGEPLWQAAPNPRRYAPAEYIKKYLKGCFDVAILDEIHEFKAGDSLQGHAMGMLLSCSEYFMGLTGTLSGGYADDLFYLLYRANPQSMREFGYHGVENWQKLFGVLEEVEIIDDDDHTYGRQKKRNRIIKRRPGVSPEVIGRYFLDKSCFIRLSDVIESLPPYDEYVISVELGQQEEHYKRLEQQFAEAVREFKKLAIGAMLQSLLCYPDSAVVFPEDVDIKDRTGRVLANISAPMIERSQLLPKEKELLSIIKEERAAKRKVLVYLVFTGRRDIRKRLVRIIEAKGYRVGILPETVEPKNREKWIEDHAEEFDVLIANPELVKVGLDLIQFPTIVFFEVGYKIFTLRQAARRSWRIGQNQPVKVYYLCYQKTLQEAALVLMAKKLEVAFLTEGDMPEGLGQYNSSGGSIAEELASALVEGRAITGAETVWANMRKKEVESSLEIGKDEVAFSELTTVKKPAVKHEKTKTTVTENTVVNVTVITKGKRKMSRMSVRYGDLDKELQGKIVQFELF